MRYLIIGILLLFLSGCEEQSSFIMTPELQFEQDVQRELYEARVKQEALMRLLAYETKETK